MKPEEQRIAIAEACGWTKHRNNNHKASPDIPLANAIMWEYDFVPPGMHRLCYSRLPNYTEDLNAMHEAEKHLTDNQWEKYVVLLHNMHKGFRHAWKPSECNQKLVAHSTATQRAEAFLCAIGKWKE